MESVIFLAHKVWEYGGGGGGQTFVIARLRTNTSFLRLCGQSLLCVSVDRVAVWYVYLWMELLCDVCIYGWSCCMCAGLEVNMDHAQLENHALHEQG